MKELRQKIIKDAVSSDSIRNQSEIMSLLRGKGFDVTQASISRDLEEIGVRKQNGVYAWRPGNGLSSAFGKVRVETSGGSLIVVKCRSGLASALAVQLDSMELPEIVGTIAGDDTVFVAMKNARGQAKVLKTLKERFLG